MESGRGAMREVDLSPQLRADAELRVIRAFGKSLFVSPLWCAVLGVAALIAGVLILSVIAFAVHSVWLAVMTFVAGAVFTWLVVAGLLAIPHTLVGRRPALAAFGRMQTAALLLGGGVAALVAVQINQRFGNGVAAVAFSTFLPALWLFWRTSRAAAFLSASPSLAATYDPSQESLANARRWREWRDLVLGIPPIVDHLSADMQRKVRREFETASLNEAYAMYGLPFVAGVFARPQVVETSFAVSSIIANAGGLAVYAGFVLLATAATIYVVPAMGRQSRTSAQQSARITLDELVTTDTRAPVLFLRPFADDNFSVSAPRQGFLSRIATGGYSPANVDELLGSRLN